MRVIHQGTDPKTVPLRGTCSNCKTTVEFTKQETVIEYERNHTLHKVVCPTCGQFIFGTEQK